MAASKSMVFLLVVTVLAAFRLQSTVAQTRHVVGDSLGWTIPTNGAAAYTMWASQQTFTVGDTLVFNFPTGAHNVAEVSEAAYGPCTTTNPMSIVTDGPANITLMSPGNHYYICTIGSGSHCQAGQKLTINVAAAAGTPPSTIAPTPGGGSSMPPPPPRQNGASAFTAVVPVTFLAAALALFY